MKTYVLAVRSSECDRLPAVLNRPVEFSSVTWTDFALAFGCSLTDEEIMLIRLGFARSDVHIMDEDKVRDPFS